MAHDAEKLAGQVERLRELKKLARITNLEIANAVGVTERQVQRWMSLKAPSDIDAPNLKKLSAFLGTSADYIEYGSRRSRTPELLESLEDRALERLAETLAGIDEQISQLSLQLAAHDAEVQQRLDEGFGPSQRSRPRRQPRARVEPPRSDAR